jgi:hypothetical protein
VRRNSRGDGLRENGAAMTTQTRIQPDKIRRMAKPPMVQKTYRVPKTLYELAMEKAAEREENLSDVIREALERYVKRPS